MQTNKNNFDALRLIAASMVLLGHGYILSGRKDPLAVLTKDIESLGSLGVSIFFVISGYLIANSLTRSSSLVSFAINRGLRIFPALIVCVFISVFAGCILTKLPLSAYAAHPDTYAYLLNATLYTGHALLPGVFNSNPLPNLFNGSIWTLPVEVAMYVSLVICRAIGGFSSRFALIVPMVLFLLLCQWVKIEYAIFNNTVPLYFVLKHGISFYSGVLLFLWRNRIKLDTSIFQICAALLIITLQTPYSRAVFMIAVPYMAIYIAFCDKVKLQNVGKYGDFSYGMYIYGFIVEQATQQILGHTSFYRYMLISYFSTLLCGFLSWHLVEKRALKLKGKFQCTLAASSFPGFIVNEDKTGSLRAEHIALRDVNRLRK